MVAKEIQYPEAALSQAFQFLGHTTGHLWLCQFSTKFSLRNNARKNLLWGDWKLWSKKTKNSNRKWLKWRRNLNISKGGMHSSRLWWLSTWGCVSITFNNDLISVKVHESTLLFLPSNLMLVVCNIWMLDFVINSSCSPSWSSLMSTRLSFRQINGKSPKIKREHARAGKAL